MRLFQGHECPCSLRKSKELQEQKQIPFGNDRQKNKGSCRSLATGSEMEEKRSASGRRSLKLMEWSSRLQGQAADFIASEFTLLAILESVWSAVFSSLSVSSRSAAMSV